MVWLTFTSDIYKAGDSREWHIADIYMSSMISDKRIEQSRSQEKETLCFESKANNSYGRYVPLPSTQQKST